MVENSNILLAFGLTAIAGLSTGIGSLFALFAKSTSKRFLSFTLGLSAGVMIYVSFMELMPESVTLLENFYTEKKATLYMLLAFFAGIGLIALIDRLVPSEENPHEVHYEEDAAPNRKLGRTGIMMALAIGIHNFPEGLATFASALADMEIALPIMFAVALHNIPEGIAVSVPIYHATKNRKKAFWYSFLSGMAEPIGAVVGFLFLQPFWTPSVNAFLLSLISGIMVYISFDELLPGTERFGYHHYGIAGVILGMAVMACSLLMF